MVEAERKESQGKGNSSWESSSFVDCIVGLVSQVSCFSSVLDSWNKITPECSLVSNRWLIKKTNEQTKKNKR